MKLLKNFLRRKTIQSLYLLRNVNFSIKHHWVSNKKIFLNIYQHKGYWWYGKKRENNDISMFYKIIKKNDIVYDIGAHIGYMSIIFSDIVGMGGKVFSFEPSPYSFNYLKKNLDDFHNCKIIKKGVSNKSTHKEFFTEDLTGQNSSFEKDFQGLRNNYLNSGVKKINTNTIIVQTSTIDLFSHDNELIPKFIKIDVEGHELKILEGAVNTIRNSLPNFMIELNKLEDKENLINYFFKYDYKFFQGGLEIAPSNLSIGNIFCLNRETYNRF